MKVYWNPTAAKQWYSTQEQFDQADRVKLRYITTVNYDQHFLPGLMPPGELVTIEIS